MMSSQIDITIENLPIEILITILAYVDPLTLNYISLVCKKWHNILNNDSIWHSIFKLTNPKYDTIFPSISRSNKFKKELILRNSFLHSFKRGKLINQSFNNIINFSNLSSIIKINWLNNKLTIIDIPRETIVTCDIRNGRGRKYINDFVPEGVTTFNTSSRILMFGRWDGSVSSCFINYKGLILSQINKLGSMPGGRIKAVTSCNSSMIDNDLKSISLFLKSGKIGAFSCDEMNNLYGWDLKTGDCLFKFKLTFNHSPTPELINVIKIESDGKSFVILILENGEIYRVGKEIFNAEERSVGLNVEKIGTTFLDFNDSPIFNYFVDYGGDKIVVWSDFELLAISTNSEGHQITYKPKRYLNDFNERLLLTHVSFEANDKRYMKQDSDIVGTDPLFACIVINNSMIDVINIRETSNFEFDIMNRNPIIPRFINEHDNDASTSTKINKISSICLTSTIIGIVSNIGKVEIFDLITGEYLRTVIDRIGKRKLQEFEMNLPHGLINNNLIKLFIDEIKTRGILIFGSYIQYFQCGKLEDDLQSMTSKRINKRFNDKKGDFNEEVRFTLDNYEEEKLHKQKNLKLISKFNGDVNPVNEKDQLELALAISMSLENDISGLNNVVPDDSQDELKRAMELSLQAQHQENSNAHFDELMDEDMRKAMELSLNISDTQESRADRPIPTLSPEEESYSDEEIRRAIELSKLENYRTWGQDYDDEQWQEL